MALRLEDHVFRVLENQDALYNLLGEHRWDFDMEKGTVVFSTSKGSGGLLGRFFAEAPREIASCPVQLIGSESARDNTWLWSWANEKSDIPPYLTRGVAQIRDEARGEGPAPFFDPNPIPMPSPRFGTELAIICTGHLGLFTYYACPHSGGVIHLAIVEPPEGIAIERDALQVTRILHIGMTALEFNHKEAIVAYLGEPARREGDALEWDIGQAVLRLEFDEQGRSTRMTTSAGASA